MTGKKYLSVGLMVSLVILAAVFFTLAINKRFAPGGELEVTQLAGAKTWLMERFLPDFRLGAQGKDANGIYRELTGQPVEIGLSLPRKFQQLSVEMTYANANVPVVSLGLESGPDNKFDFQTVENKILERLQADPSWKVVQEEGTWLFQRQTVKKFDSVPSFLSELPSDRVAQIDYNLQPYFRLGNYQPSQKEITIKNTLRGSHQILTYIKNEPLDFTFSLQDINRADGPDPVSVSVYKDDELLLEKGLSDDGLVSATDPTSPTRSINLNLPNLAEGVYRIEFSADDDVVINEIHTRQSKIVFLNKLYLIGNEEYSGDLPGLNLAPTTVYSDGHEVDGYTSHYRGLQEIKINGAVLNIDQTHREYIHRETGQINTGSYPISLPKNDILLTSTGVFSFRPEQFFDPNFYPLDTNGSLSGVDYIIANYSSPVQKNGLLTASVNFDLAKGYFTGNDIRLEIGAPDVSPSNPLKIYQIKVKLMGEKLSWTQIISMLFHLNSPHE